MAASICAIMGLFVCINSKTDIVTGAIEIPVGKGQSKGLISTYISGVEYRWVWLILTFIGAFLPFVLGLFMDVQDAQDRPYRYSDIIYAGIAMNLSNIGLVGAHKFKEKDVIVLMSMVLTIFLSFCLPQVWDENKKVSLMFCIMFHVLTAFSLIFSYSANEHVFLIVKEKK